MGIRLRRKGSKRAPSRETKSSRHPECVAFLWRGVSDRPGRAPFTDWSEQSLAYRLRELLGVPEPRRNAPDSASHHRHSDREWSGPGPPSDFVHSSDELVAGTPQLSLVCKVGSRAAS